LGALQTITRLFPAIGDVYQQGPVGENVLHVALLLNTPSTLAIARYLISVYGESIVNTPYQERKSISDPPGLYEGQTAIHIAIVNHDLDMVKFLLANGANTRARAYGPFFKRGGHCYYGEFPLSFAASTGQLDVVTFLCQNTAKPGIDAGTAFLAACLARALGCACYVFYWQDRTDVSISIVWP
jgi:ankyrin repeat protein